jgi:hypothetical protein
MTDKIYLTQNLNINRAYGIPSIGTLRSFRDDGDLDPTVKLKRQGVPADVRKCTSILIL